MRIFNTIKNVLNSASVYAERVRSRHRLLAMSDRLLEDAGISRELLENGVSAWPWHAIEDADPSRRITVDGATLFPSVAGNPAGLTISAVNNRSTSVLAEPDIHRSDSESAHQAA